MLTISGAEQTGGRDLGGRELIALAQKLARDAEHHALLSTALATQADRLMEAGLARLRSPRRQPPAKSC